jgi:hypothetical protein
MDIIEESQQDHTPVVIEIPIKKKLTKKQRNPSKYIDFAIRRNLVNGYFKWCIFPTKEISESIAPYYAIKRYEDIDMLRYAENVNIKVYCLGDGNTPRTAFVLASLSHWTIYSIDPALQVDKILKYERPSPKCMDRVHLFPIKSEQFTDIDMSCDLSIVVGVHSHAPFEEFWSRVPSPKLGIAIPCCVKHEIKNLNPIESYEDDKILSEKRTVIIWRC